MARLLSRAGFTLAETILSAFILALTMMALFNLFPGSAMAARRAELQLQADAIAQQHLEECRARAFTDLTLGPLIFADQEYPGGIVFRGAGEVFQVEDADTDLLKGVRVRVDWTYRGRDFHLTHEAWIANVPR